MQPNEWVPILTLATNIGFSVVVAWYLLSKALPAMQERFSADLRAQRDDYRAASKQERDDFAGVVKMLMDSDRNAIKRTVDNTSEILRLVKYLTHREAAARGVSPPSEEQHP